MAKICGSCNLQGTSLPKNKIVCLYDNSEHDALDTCKHWQTYISGISIEVRRQTASDIRNREDDERRHKENQESAQSNRKLQIILVILSFFLWIGAFLLTEWIISRW